MKFSSEEIHAEFDEVTTTVEETWTPWNIESPETARLLRAQADRVMQAPRKARKRETNRLWAAANKDKIRAYARRPRPATIEARARKAALIQSRLDACLCFICGLQAKRVRNGTYLATCEVHRDRRPPGPSER